MWSGGGAVCVLYFNLTQKWNDHVSSVLTQIRTEQEIRPKSRYGLFGESSPDVSVMQPNYDIVYNGR
jgi:hypothetical protein